MKTRGQAFVVQDYRAHCYAGYATDLSEQDSDAGNGGYTMRHQFDAGIVGRRDQNAFRDSFQSQDHQKQKSTIALRT